MYQLPESALDRALEHLRFRGDTDIFPIPFEYEAIEQEWADVKGYIASKDLDNWTVRPLRRCLSPKQNLGLRIATQLDPLDSIIITALVYEAGADLERARIPTDTEIVHSYRFSPGDRGQLYDPHWNFESFRKRSLELAEHEQHSIVVITDISDFYPRIYSHPLETF